MATQKVIDMSSRVAGAAYDEYVYLTGASPDTDERWPAAYLRQFILDGITGGYGIDAVPVGNPAAANTTVDLVLDVSELTAAAGTADVTDYVVIEAASDNSTKKILIGSLPFVTAAVSDVASLSSNLTASPTTGNVKIDLATTLTGLTSVESTGFTGALTGNADTATTAVTVTGATQAAITSAANLVTVGTVTSGTWSTGAVIADATMTLGSDSTGDTYYRDAAGKLKNLGIGSTGDHLEVVGGIPDWQAAGHGAGTVYSVDDGAGIVSSTGSAITGAGTLSVENTANGGLEFSVAGDTGTLQVAQGISQYDVAQFATGVVDDDFLRIDGTAVEGRSASEVKTDIGLGNVENTALSTWTGSTNIVSTGTLTAGFIEGESTASTGVLSTGALVTKFLRADGDNSSSWQIPPDTNTTYTAGDGLDLSVGNEFSTDLKPDGGVVIESTELAVDLGASSMTGTLAVGDGGTGQTSYTNGQLLIGNTTGNTLTKATLTEGANITITEAAGSITIAAAAGGDPAGTAVAMAIALGG